ncbi:MAG: ABC transporter ATP-binding protein [Deltaproteobacteria bacterium]|nr:ABC transporter ATP-binding protein [Deltaproteobacteria bacterium]
MGVAVEVSGLVRTFHKGGARIEVLRGAELALQPGDSAALVGQSGSGKSTFLHILGGLEAPTGGTVSIDGRPLYSRAQVEIDRFRNTTVGFIFQFHHLLPDHSAIDNVAIPAMIARVPKAEARERARAALERVGLAHRLGHRPGELSGGEQQRVAIARALLMRPGLVLADEPTGNLDPHTASEVMALLLELNREGGATLVVVTHSMELAARFPRRLRMVDGAFAEAA